MVYIVFVNFGGGRFEIKILIFVFWFVLLFVLVVIGFVFEGKIVNVIFFVKDVSDILVDMMFFFDILNLLLGFKWYFILVFMFVFELNVWIFMIEVFILVLF